MNEAVAFDTHRYVKRLTASGFSEQQAETLAEEQVAFLNSNLATNTDIATIHKGIDSHRRETEANIEQLRQSTEASIEQSRLSTEASIEQLRLSTEAKIEKLKSELVKWLFAALIAQGGLFVALVKIL